MREAETSAKRAETLRDEAKALNAEAKALRERAKATEDAEDKEKLLEDAEKKSSQAADKSSKATDLASKKRGTRQPSRRSCSPGRSPTKESVTVRRPSVGEPRRQVERHADAYGTGPSRMSRPWSMLAVEDAEVQAAEAAATVAPAFRLRGCRRRRRRRRSTTPTGGAGVGRRRGAGGPGAGRGPRREVRIGRRSEGAQRSLREQAAEGGTAGRAIKELIRSINFPNLFKELRTAQEKDVKARKERGGARELERAANRIGNLADVLPEATSNLVQALAAGRITDAEFNRRVRHTLNTLARAAKAGRK